MVGPLELVLVIIVAIVMAVIVLISNAARRKKPARQGDAPASKSRDNTSRALNRSGITLVILGILGLLFAISLFRTVLSGYFWAFLVIGIGSVLLILSARR